MFKKGLVTLVCLIVMSAVWSWATATYTVSTEIASLGTKLEGGAYVPVVGGTIKTRTAAGVDPVAEPAGAYNPTQTGNTRGFTVLDTKDVEVQIDAAGGYKIASVTKTSTEVLGAAPVTTTLVTAAENLKSKLVTLSAPTVAGKTQYIKVTFTADTDTDVIKRTWQLQANNNNGGGSFTLTRAGVVTPYTTVGKPLVKNYIDTTPVTVTATPKDSGYKIDYVVINGVKDNTDRDTFSMTVSGNPLRLNTFNFGYKKLSIPVTTTTTQKRNAAGELMFVVDANGVSQPVYDDLGILPINPAADPYGVVRLIVSPTANQNVVKTVTVAHVNAADGAFAASNVTLTDRFGDPATLPFTGAVKVTINNITKPIKVTTTYGTAAEETARYTNCTQTCHIDPSLVAVKPQVKAADTNWLLSGHKTGGVDCVSCHQVMPGPDFSTPALTEALCVTCHTSLNQHTAAANQCSVCHSAFGDSHNPVSALNAGVNPGHFGASATRAQYVGKNAACTDCHGTTNSNILVEWAESGHAKVAESAWSAEEGTNASCSRCHTVTGFISNPTNTGTSAILAATDPQEVLNCNGCHTDVATGALRVASAAYTLPYKIMPAAVNGSIPALGASSTCIPCHGGRSSGANITSATFTQRFTSPHYLPAGGVMFNAIGYHYAGQTYNTAGFHKTIDTTGNGPCVTCHMNSAAAGKGHTFEAVTKTDGVITAINTAAACAGCHADMTPAKLVTDKASFVAALDTLKDALQTKQSAFYNSADGKFYTTAIFVNAADGKAYTDAAFTTPAAEKKSYSSIGAFGAAFNYFLLEHAEPAAYVHNRGYALKLIADSVEFLNTGAVTGNFSNTAIAAAKAGHDVAAPTAAGCDTCHFTGSAIATTPVNAEHMGGTTLVKAQFVAQSLTCANCHAGNNAAILGQWADSGHGDVAGDPWYHYDWAAGGTRLTCQRCHTATGFINNATGVAAGTNLTGSKAAQVLACSACHSDVATGAVRDLSAQNTVDYSAVANDTVIYPNVGASNVCISCHAGMGANGNTIKNTTGDFNAMSAIQPHYFAAAGTLMGRTGYEFTGVTYTDGYHKNIGVADFKGTGNSGPCVACHMSGANHTFEVSANATCAQCHEGLTNAAIEEAKVEYNAAVEELNQALKAKGIWFIPSYPYFVADNGCISTSADNACTGTDPAEVGNGVLSDGEKNRANGFKKWEDAVAGTDNGDETMGAGFNYNLLVHEPGAFAHNRTYAYQLIASSIDFLNDGKVGSASGNVNPDNKAKELLADETHINVAAQDNVCSTCHAPGLPAPATSIAATLGGVHAVGQAEATPAFTVNGDDLDITFAAKVDGAAATGYSATRVYRYFDDSANGNGWVSWRFPTAAYTVSETAGNYTVKILGGAAKAADNSRYYVRLEKTGAAVPRIAAVGNYPASPVNDLVSNQACTNCHGGKIPVHEMNPLSFEVCVVCHGADKSTSNGGTSYSASTYPKLGYLLHGVHASEKVMPSGEFVFKTGAEPFKVAYPTYMNNCSVCHTDSADLAVANAKPVSYAFCMTCHENFTGFDHGNTVFTGVEHAGFTAATNCSGCHAGDTAATMHNGLLTERSGVIWNGVDTSVTEGARINTTINSVERVGGNLLVKWAATFDGAPVDPCYGPSDAVNKPSWKNAASGFSVLRAYSQGDDWGNAGIFTSPGQPASTNLDFTAVTGNTVCADNVATTTIALSTAEKASTSAKIAVALQGKPNLYNANLPTPAPAGVRAKSAYQAYNFQATDGVLTTTTRRDVTDTNSCLKCHTGSLYQHGGNRIDSMELCVMCHNENSSEQNVRLLDGVDSTEAYDGKVGQTYGFKTLLHAVHSAGENNAITMVYRTNGNYIFTGEEAAMPSTYPTGDVFADDAKYAAMNWAVADDDATKAGAIGHGSAALIYGSSAAHGTGPQTVGAQVAPGTRSASGTYTGTPVAYTAGTEYAVYRAHNVIRVTYPQDLKNCTACHKANGFGFPGTDAIPTVVDAGTVGLGGSAPSKTASNAINSNIADDLVIGATTAACMSCHNANATLEPKKKAWLDNHAPKVGAARGALAAESCTTCHKP